MQQLTPPPSIRQNEAGAQGAVGTFETVGAANIVTVVAALQNMRGLAAALADLNAMTLNELSQCLVARQSGAGHKDTNPNPKHEILTFANKVVPIGVSLFSLASHTVAPMHPTRRSARTHWFASTAHE